MDAAAHWAEALSGQENTAAWEGGDARYSLGGKEFAEDKYFARQMDHWSELEDGTRIKVGVVRRGSALNRVGLPAAGMYFDVGKIKKAMSGHSDHLTTALIKGIPDLLNDPIVITEYTGPDGTVKNTVNVYGNLFTDDKPVVVGVVMHLDRTGQSVINNIRTIHARRDFAKQITNDSILYLSENKKKVRSWLQVCGNPNVPLEGTKYVLIKGIAFDGGDVKTRNSLKEYSGRHDGAPADRVKLYQQLLEKMNTERTLAALEQVYQENMRRKSDEETLRKLMWFYEWNLGNFMQEPEDEDEERGWDWD